MTDATTFIVSLGTTLAGHTATLPAAQVFATRDDHGHLSYLPCVGSQSSVPKDVVSITRALGYQTATSDFELLNPRECESEYTYPVFSPESPVQVFMVESKEDQMYARIVAPILHGVRFHEKQAVYDLLNLIYMTEPASIGFSLDFALMFRERIFGRHAVRHGITINMILEHFGLPKQRKESFKKAKQALGLTHSSPNRKHTVPTTSAGASSPSTRQPSPNELDDKGNPNSPDPVRHRPSESHISPAQRLSEFWQKEMEPRGLPDLADALLVAEYFAGDINEVRVIDQCLIRLESLPNDTDAQYESILEVFTALNTDLKNPNVVHRALNFMKG